MDPLPSILRTMRIESAVYARLEAASPWGVRICHAHPARFGVIVEGAPWLRVCDRDPQIRLSTGDCFVLPRGGVFELRDVPERPAMACQEVIGDRIGETIRVEGSGAETVVVIGSLAFDETASRPLLDILPDVLHVPADAPGNSALRAALTLLALETANARIGADLVAGRLGEILFIQAVRAFAESEAGRKVGWLGALGDRRLGAALRALHADVGRAWTVEELAGVAGMSRSSFALRFKEAVGEAPLEHLARWRVYRATCYLRNTALSLGEIAGLTGYDSDGAFSRAFKRRMGIAPGEYRRAV
jgi:AraC-like DNA-binding protein